MIRAASLRGFETLVSDLGGDPHEWMARFGMDSSVLADDDGLISITAHDLMLDTAATELGCPDLGLRLAAMQDLSILGPLAVAIEASPTVADAVDCASRFMFVHSPALRLGLTEDPLGQRGVVALFYGKDLRESTYSVQGMELGLGVCFRVALSLIGSAVGLRSVLVPHAPVSPVRRYLDYFGADVRFGGKIAALRMNRRVLEEGFSSANAAIREVAIQHLISQFRDPHLALGGRVRLAIAESLRTSQPTIANLARLFNLHPRTLQRRLAAEGTTFGEILDDVRREAAYRYLTTTDVPIGQVALMVGFGDHSTLTHATRRWFGRSPSQVRGAIPAFDGDHSSSATPARPLTVAPRAHAADRVSGGSVDAAPAVC